ncbi:glutathione S-transferase family protein [Motilimonas pumila]|uniref:glutathione transferase n=1 Tax=Motilimonas pumila TaxID=2303987 RepID=A0A418YE50_9GAMM|nr:glutathione S-transferase family protein [Motilimonas pumila]RJG47428.1 glutathione S-transferase family protein [Motilimonas pumila]
MSLQPIELISFNLCPFVQRSVITLLKKGIDFKITYIDLSNKPDWFLAISPLGKVPVLKYGNAVLFESAVINEFLDEITPPSLLPTEPLTKAQDRAWIEYSSQLLMAQYMATLATSEAEFSEKQAVLNDRLSKIEAAMSDKRYFNSDNFALIDSALAPAFTRFDVIKQHCQRDLLANFPKLSQLARHYLALSYVQTSVIKEFGEVYLQYLSDKGSYLSTQAQ